MPGKYVARGIRWISSAAHAQQQNGAAERMQRTIDETACAVMAHAGDVPAYLWAECNNCIVFVHNHANVIKHKGKITSRWNVLEGHNKPFDHSKFRPWGCLVYAYIVKKERGGKGDQARLRARKGSFMGYQWNQKSYRVLFLDTREVRAVAMQYCITNEAVFPFRDIKIWNEQEKMMPPSYVIPQFPAELFGQQWDYEDETELYHPGTRYEEADYSHYDLDMSPDHQEWRQGGQGSGKIPNENQPEGLTVGGRVRSSGRVREPTAKAVDNTAAELERDEFATQGLHAVTSEAAKVWRLINAFYSADFSPMDRRKFFSSPIRRSSSRIRLASSSNIPSMDSQHLNA
jgi:hypothetical protein